MQEANSELSVCPSFSSYSSDGLTDIAAQVTRSEFGGGGDWRRQVGDDFQGEEFGELDNEDDFEFVSVSKADDVVVLEGQFGPVFPIFNRDFLVPEKIQLQTNFAYDPEKEEGHEALSLQVPLKKLFVEESDPSPRFSTSSEEDVEAELNGVPPGTYCIWTPNNNSNNNSAKASPSIKCKKSSSTGTGSSSASKRWRLLSLLRRCNSEGKDRLVFLTPKKEEIKTEKTDSKEKKVKKVARETMPSAHEVFYVRNRAMKEGDKRRTYLPYRQDLVGFWTSMGTLGRNLPPF
ncbi:hypothetical protein I3843_04G024600 [Carya illinoinensis]|uniref:Uncharacterized protein n=1 Tax=Carya illinoinensis TaxID=32201 RepID=A0A922F869_CARIL|nr:uncharacterized protein LOC122306932 [Carya illinoinensis]KAG6716007.1 hypothetical protein I3842_04G025800 [Carya illinoinensis]KAG7981952.1 hypothetical protein I3843_04G024600 [Carya illinoinensis]